MVKHVRLAKIPESHERFPPQMFYHIAIMVWNCNEKNWLGRTNFGSQNWSPFANFGLPSENVNSKQLKVASYTL